MTGMLAFCRCGHTRDDHVAGGGCTRINKPNAKLAVGEAVCGCDRFDPDPRLTDSDDFVGKVLEKVIAKEAIPLEPVEREEAIQVLRIQLWRTSVKYDSRSHVRFRVYAYLELYNDAIDHFRSERGRHGQHRVFDARQQQHSAGEVGDESALGDRLGDPASRDPADDPDNWAADGGGLLAVGDGPPAGGAGRPGGRDAEAAVGRDRRPGKSAPRRAGAARAGAGGAARRPAFVDCGVCGWRSYLVSPNGLPGWREPDACAACGAPLASSVTDHSKRRNPA